ncbi:MAG: MBL fold metallo-hydrolase [Rhodobacteraceae bacterium]|nr:MBL fold metallo-hydrolase [Paracoccaceae bacterium]
MRLPLPMKLDHVNVYALKDKDGWCIVDTGVHTKRCERIWQKLMAGPLDGKPINRVVVTHHHPDHVGMAGWFQREHEAELWTTRTAWLFSRMLTLDEQKVWPDETIAFYRKAGMAEEVLQKRLADRPYNFADVVYPMPLGFRRIKQGDVLELADRHWDVHIGNGHSPEHATLWSRDDGLVISGDQIIPGISSNIGVYVTEPDADPLADWLEACERLKIIARDDHFVLPGHKLPFTGLPARMTQLIENHHGALLRLLDHLDHPCTAGDCFMPLFKRSLGEAEYGLALVESVAHLNHLHQQGKVSRNQNGSGAWEWQRIGNKT